MKLSTRRSRPRHAAFTLIELLIIIAIVAVLVGLLIPAVQQVRGSAARIKCLNNLHQIGLAAQEYVNGNGQFPAGMDHQHVGSLVYLLPYLERQDVLNNFVLGESAPGPWANSVLRYWWENENNNPSASVRPAPRPRPDGSDLYGAEPTLPFFLCPANTAAQDYVTVLTTIAQGSFERGVSGWNYEWCGLGFKYDMGPGSQILGRTHYLGMGGYPYSNAGDGKIGTYTGILTWNVQVTPGEIVDGMSNTILYGEFNGGNSGGQPIAVPGIGTGKVGASWACGPNFTYWSPDPGISTDYYRFGSAHPNLFNVGFADGSARALSKTVDRSVWLDLGGYRDGQAVSDID